MNLGIEIVANATNDLTQESSHTARDVCLVCEHTHRYDNSQTTQKNAERNRIRGCLSVFSLLASTEVSMAADDLRLDLSRLARNAQRSGLGYFAKLGQCESRLKRAIEPLNVGKDEESEERTRKETYAL